VCEDSGNGFIKWANFFLLFTLNERRFSFMHSLNKYLSKCHELGAILGGGSKVMNKADRNHTLMDLTVLEE
jgi:hypothetical protein